MPSLSALSRELARGGDVKGADAQQSRALRRAQGAFFTPAALVSFVVEQVLEMRFAGDPVTWHPDGYPNLRILDPAAGDGRFLVAAAEALARRGKRLGTNVCPQQIRRHCLVAIERDAEYAAIARANLGGDTPVHCAEALMSECLADCSVDVVLGNPPYLRSIALGVVDDALRTRLRDRYAATSHGEWDLYAAFLEQGIAWLREGGMLGMVVPSRWWTARWAGPLRAKLANRGSVSSLVDFGNAQIFSGATVYASVCFASATASESVEIAKLERGSWEVGSVERACTERNRGTSQLVLIATLLSMFVGEVGRWAKSLASPKEPVPTRTPSS